MLTRCVFDCFVYSMAESFDEDMVLGADCTSVLHSPLPSRRCCLCKKFANNVDPHDTCVRCRGTVCSFERRCIACLTLSELDFGTYSAYASRTLESPRSGNSNRSKRLPQASPSPSIPSVPVPEELAALISTMIASQLKVQPGPGAVRHPTGGDSDQSSQLSSASTTASRSTPAAPIPLLSVPERVAMVYQLFPDMPRPKAVAHGIQGSVGSVPIRDEVSERAFATAPLLEQVGSSLDDSFASASLRSLSLSVPPWKKSSFPVHDLPFSGISPTAESHTDRLGLKAPPSVVLTQTQLTAFDTAARHNLQVLSHADTYLGAAASILADSPRESDQQLLNALHGVNASLEYLTVANTVASGQFLHLRRQGYVAASSLDAANREVLMQQPWTSQTLFNNQVPVVLKDHNAAQAALSTQRALSFMGSVGRRSQFAASSAKVVAGPSQKPAASHVKRPFSKGPGGFKTPKAGHSGKKGKWGSKPSTPSSKH